VALDGNLLPKGQPIVISIVGLHHDSANWNEPDIFDCSRPEFLNDTYDRRAFLPFLAGPRMCGGAKLARLELVEGFKALIRHFSVQGASDEIGFDYGLALRPRASAKLVIVRRAS
jgi:cytochrome P450